MRRWLAGQFARPHGLAGRWLIGPWLDRIGERMNALTLKQLRLGQEDDLLEVGFGGGGLLAKAGPLTRGRIFGVDASAAMVGRGRKRFAGEERVRLYEGEAEKLPVADASVDKACSVNSLYFWSDPAKALTELKRVLRPGGRLALCFEPAEELRKWPGHRYGFRLFDEEEVKALMEQAGFVAIERAEGRGRKPDRFICLSGEKP
ncbi:MAG: class I SAM-dependent methyltransferase [Sphingosinicella sp.]